MLKTVKLFEERALSLGVVAVDFEVFVHHVDKRYDCTTSQSMHIAAALHCTASHTVKQL
jgi:hypothetical protein